jgi:asparagine synthase (glutamine-hydrolysing)
MSGIVAIFDRDGNSVDRDVFRAALSQIDHRGPDGRGAWRDGPVALGHQQLQSTPEARYDSQPYRDGDLVVTADARLDNRDELFRALDISNRGEPIPDSHLLLEAYREWGTACADHLVGAFAFVIWDGNAEQVFCARDHFGVKPVYYRHDDDDVFAVASELKSLLALPSVPRTLDEVRIGDFLVGLFGDKTNTMYEGLDRLPPAHATVVDADGAETWQYWDLDPTRTISLESDAAYERRFRELFEQAVEDRLRTSAPVGVTLSGGMDSSSVTAVARDRLPAERPLHTFSWAFDDTPESDEREYVEPLIARDGIDPHDVSMDGVGSLVDADAVFQLFDEPPHNTMHYCWWETSKLASELEVGTLLTGALGDSAVSYGLGLFPDLLRSGQLRTLYARLRKLSDRRDAPMQHLFKRLVVLPLVPDPVLRRHRAFRGQRVLEARWNPTLDPAFVDRTGLHSRHKTLYEDWSLFRQTARWQQYESVTAGLGVAELESIDLRSAAFGFEPRHPFADKRLVEFSLAMPAAQQLADGYTRSIIRRSLDDLLPEKVRTRLGKTSVSEGFWYALEQEDDRLRAMLDRPGRLDEFLDLDALRTAYDGFTDGGTGTDPFQARGLWRALSLWEWLNRTASDDPPERAFPVA